MDRKEAKDYKGPTLDVDRDAGAAYITLDNTQEVARTNVLHRDPSRQFVILADISHNGDILGIEVMW